MAAEQFNMAACIAELERFNDYYSTWDRDRFASLERGNSILCGTDNNDYQLFCKAYRDAETLAEGDLSVRAVLEQSRKIFNDARRNGLTLTTGPFAGPL